MTQFCWKCRTVLNEKGNVILALITDQSRGRYFRYGLKIQGSSIITRTQFLSPHSWFAFLELAPLLGPISLWDGSKSSTSYVVWALNSSRKWEPYLVIARNNGLWLIGFDWVWCLFLWLQGHTLLGLGLAQGFIPGT